MTRRNRFAGLAAWAALVVVLESRTANAEPIQAAIDRGVAHLKSIQGVDGRWVYSELGATALAGLTLLECDVPVTDPAVRKAAATLRPASIAITHTYSLALTILFLDRLGDPLDVPLIESMAVRLLAGQGAAGGWTYACPAISAEEVRRLTKHVEQRPQLIANKPDPARAPFRKPGERPELPKAIQDQLRLINVQVPAQQFGDNSNTQFATIALWVVRRHGIPVEQAVARLVARHRASQNADGGWSYAPTLLNGAGTSTPAMTCAGLLGLAVAHGVANDIALRKDPKAVKGVRDAAKDPAVKAGLFALATTVGRPVGKNNAIVPPAANGGEYYYLWSLERVMVAYGLDTIGKKDWYAWGSQLLLISQQQDGSWHGSYATSGADTCFALLFLRRANLAVDLSARLKGQVQDPGAVSLKAGGVGGETPIGKGANPANPKDPADPADVVGPGKDPAPRDTPLIKNPEAEVGRLRDQLVSAAQPRQAELIDVLKDSKGAVYTQALAEAIRTLNGSSKVKARDALAERLARMNSLTLRGKLRDDEPEVRRAGALACAMKEEKSYVPDLIVLLADPEATVSRAAYVALKSLTNKDLGPTARATPAERNAAIAAWKAWWKKEGSK